MNERLMKHYLLEEGYTEDEIEDRMSEIAEDINDRRRDDDLEREMESRS